MLLKLLCYNVFVFYGIIADLNDKSFFINKGMQLIQEGGQGRGDI